MNVERWIKTRNASWLRLEHLLARVGKSGLGSLPRNELQELGLLYRTVSSDLSRARAMRLGQDMQIYLNNLVVKAHNQVYQRKIDKGGQILDFFLTGFPTLVRRYIPYVLTAFLICVVPFTVGFNYAKNDVHFGQMELVAGHPVVPEDLWPLIERGEMWTDQTDGYSGSDVEFYLHQQHKSCLVRVCAGHHIWYWNSLCIVSEWTCNRGAAWCVRGSSHGRKVACFHRLPWHS